MTNSVKILVVDDELGMREMLARHLGKQGYSVVTAQDGEEALRALRQEDFQLMISDIKMPRLGGLETLSAVKKINPDVEVILVTGFATIDTAVAAMKRGAYDFLQKPFSVDELLALVEKALEKKELKAVVALYEASQAMFRTIKLDVLLPTITKLTRAVLRADDVSIMLTKGDDFEIVASMGLQDGEEDARLALVRRAGRQAPEIVAGLPGVKAAMVQPLRSDGELVGVLCAGRTTLSDPFNAADMRHMAIFGSQIAQAVCNARAFEQLRESQDRLIHSERMSAVGRLSSKVAHELNNPLTSILGLAQLMLKDEGLSATQREDLECVVEQSERCRVITQGLLQFGRKSAPYKEPLALATLIESSLRLARLDIEAGEIHVDVAMADPRATISADLQQMQQVFLNLIVNAAHAMEQRKGKTLDIRVETAPGRVRILFHDNGCGVSKGDLAKIFEPFFTTKPIGKGTGLGLSVCRDIVERHGGSIAVSSDGDGTTFSLELPLYTEGAGALKPQLSGR